MRDEKVMAAKKAAKEFLRRLNVIEEAIAKGTAASLSDQPRETGALRRQSMELTRALADMRRP